MKRLFSLVAFLLTLTALSACSSNLDEVEGPCADLTVVGPADKNGVVKAVTDRIGERTSSDVRWVDSYSYGKDLPKLVEKCPETPVGLVAFGDDAAGLHAWVAMQDEEELADIKFVGLISDPSLNIDDEVEHTALARTKTFGSGVDGPGEKFQPFVVDRVVQICSWRDARCNDEIKEQSRLEPIEPFYIQDLNLNKLVGHLTSKL